MAASRRPQEPRAGVDRLIPRRQPDLPTADYQAIIEDLEEANRPFNRQRSYPFRKPLIEHVAEWAPAAVQADLPSLFRRYRAGGLKSKHALQEDVWGLLLSKRAATDRAELFIRATERMIRSSGAEKRRGARGKRAVLNLVLRPFAGYTGRGRPRRTDHAHMETSRGVVPGSSDRIPSLRVQVLGEVRAAFAAGRSQAVFEHLVRKHFPDDPPDLLSSRARSLFHRKAKRPSDIANQIVGWLVGESAAKVQALARS